MNDTVVQRALCIGKCKRRDPQACIHQSFSSYYNAELRRFGRANSNRATEVVVTLGAGDVGHAAARYLFIRAIFSCDNNGKAHQRRADLIGCRWFAVRRTDQSRRGCAHCCWEQQQRWSAGKQLLRIAYILVLTVIFVEGTTIASARAAYRAIPKLLSCGVSVKVERLPEGPAFSICERSRRSRSFHRHSPTMRSSGPTAAF